MKFGASMFFTDYSMGPAEFAVALEERGFDIVWAPEHSHIPLSRTTAFLFGGELPKHYYDVMDPFVTLTAAAMATRTLKIGTGVCLLPQRDPIQTAKLVASIDQVSGGRFVFGVGNGWNRDEMENHGTDFETRHKRAQENIEATGRGLRRSRAQIGRCGLCHRLCPAAWPRPQHGADDGRVHGGPRRRCGHRNRGPRRRPGGGHWPRLRAARRPHAGDVAA